jgi:hypothetical protein
VYAAYYACWIPHRFDAAPASIWRNYLFGRYAGGILSCLRVVAPQSSSFSTATPASPGPRLPEPFPARISVHSRGAAVC